MNAAIIHDWLTGMRGGEKVLQALLDVFPDAEIFTLISNKKRISEKIRQKKIHVSFLQKIPGIFKNYRNFLPLFPAAIESFDLKKFDLIISSSHCVAKGAVRGKNAVHVCYCHTPMRYAYDQFGNYFSEEKNGKIKYFLIKKIMPALRNWDVKTSARVDYFIANSENVRQRIKKYYDRESEVIYPPVDTNFFTVDDKVKREDFYLLAGALAEYKKPDFVVKMFSERLKDKKLMVVGNGAMSDYIEKIKGENVILRKDATDEELRDYYRKAKAFIFAGEEDFGITMAEANACGTPVLALNKGGALEIIKEGDTGEFFDGTEEDFIKKLVKMDKTLYDVKKMRENALRFSEDKFIFSIKEFLKRRNLFE
ncbi:MAG: glycosyltransferase [Candidatus Goldbacteria bacterium]|nr:glycosyltransferase [Candidatus Goldiibacteriota bacterium]